MICEWQTFLWWWWWWWLGLLWKIEAHPSFPQFIQPRLALCLIRLGRSEENMTIDHFATWPDAAGYFASHKNKVLKKVSAQPPDCKFQLLNGIVKALPVGDVGLRLQPSCFVVLVTNWEHQCSYHNAKITSIFDLEKFIQSQEICVYLAGLDPLLESPYCSYSLVQLAWSSSLTGRMLSCLVCLFAYQQWIVPRSWGCTLHRAHLVWLCSPCRPQPPQTRTWPSHSLVLLLVYYSSLPIQLNLKGILKFWDGTKRKSVSPTYQ